MLWEYLEVSRNPMSLVELKGVSKRTRKPRVLTQDEFRVLLEHISEEPVRTVVLTAMCLGLRCSELIGLKWSDFNWQNQTLMIQRSVVAGRVDDVKTEHSHAMVPLDPALVEILLAWRGRTEFTRIAIGFGRHRFRPAKGLSCPGAFNSTTSSLRGSKQDSGRWDGTHCASRTALGWTLQVHPWECRKT